MNNHYHTKESAATFEYESITHSALLEDTAKSKGCTCAPYIDWFTYNRWQALGYQVQRGEHGVKLTTYVKVEKPADDKEKSTKQIPRVTTVFCRCQVKAISEVTQ